MATGRVLIADRVKQGKDGKWTRGGWTSPDQTWAVIDAEAGSLIEVELEEPPLSKRAADDLTYGRGEEENDEADEEADRG